MDLPLVTVICTTYNQEEYVEAALASVLDQTYPEVELIVVDNASTDSTLHRINQVCLKHPGIRIIANNWNKGLCAAFNQGLVQARGKYIIDLSGDDVLLPNRIERQVAFFEEQPANVGVVFSNARYISSEGQLLRTHFETDDAGKSVDQIPSGDVYREILENYFICTPTMMMKRSVLEKLGGYDESLTYEDFDFWVRSSVRYHYAYQDEVLTHKRVLSNSLASQVYKPGSGMLHSTYAVCNKAYDLNRNQAEFDTLARRIRTFIRKCFYAQEFELAIQFRKLLNYIEDPDPVTDFIVMLCRMRLPINRLYRLYLSYYPISKARRKHFQLKFVLSE